MRAAGALLLLAASPCPAHARLHSRGGAGLEGASLSPTLQDVIHRQGNVRAQLVAERDQALSALQASEAAGKAARLEVASLQKQLEAQGRLLQDMREELQAEHGSKVEFGRQQHNTSASDEAAASGTKVARTTMAPSKRLFSTRKDTQRRLIQPNKEFEAARTRAPVAAETAEKEPRAQPGPPRPSPEGLAVQASAEEDGLRAADVESEASAKEGDIGPKDGELEELTGVVKATKSELKALDAGNLQNPAEEPARRVASPSVKDLQVARELSAVVDAELQKHRDTEDLQRATASAPEAAAAAAEVAAAAAAARPAGAPDVAAATEIAEAAAEAAPEHASTDDLTMMAFAGGPESGPVEANVVGLDVEPLPVPAESEAVSP